MIDIILRISARNLQYARTHLEDIEDSKWAHQPSGVINHPAWIVGHIAGSYEMLAAMLELPPTLPADWADKFGWGSTPVADRSAYPSKQALLDALDSQHRRLADAIAKVRPETLAKPIEDEMLRQILPTVGDCVYSILTSHEAIHLGQLGAWRLAMGMALKV